MALQAQSANLGPSPEQEFQKKVAEVGRRFSRSLPEQLVEMGALFTRIQEGREAADALAGIRGMAHKIRGIAPTLGFGDLGTAAARLEDTIFAFSTPDTDYGDMAQKFVRHYQALADEMSRAAS